MCTPGSFATFRPPPGQLRFRAVLIWIVKAWTRRLHDKRAIWLQPDGEAMLGGKPGGVIHLGAGESATAFHDFAFLIALPLVSMV
jgi:hypothetical protein